MLCKVRFFHIGELCTALSMFPTLTGLGLYYVHLDIAREVGGDHFAHSPGRIRKLKNLRTISICNPSSGTLVPWMLQAFLFAHRSALPDEELRILNDMTHELDSPAAGKLRWEITQTLDG